MASNIAECVNSCLKHARQMLITVLIEFIRDMFQRWFHERFNDAHRFLVKPINRVEFEVKNGKMDGLVNLSRNTCSCCEFQTDLLPCSHAITVISKCNREAIEFCGSIRPVGHPSEWDIPPHVKQIVILPPPWLGQAGRPRRRRISSAGKGSRAWRCSQCKRYGHNRHNCPYPFSVPSTNLAPSPSQSVTPRLRRPKACSSCRQTVTQAITVQYEGQCLKIFVCSVILLGIFSYGLCCQTFQANKHVKASV
ncbi:zinc finger protein [Theobroma cacao]|nr:zinc finger protein [Theobroma cacao]